MKLLKIGNKWLNMGQVRQIVNLDSEVIVDFGREESAIFRGNERDRLLAYLNHPDNSDDIDPSEETESYQYYVRSGGCMAYETWLRKYREYQRICEIDNATAAQLDILVQLESDLLF